MLDLEQIAAKSWKINLGFLHGYQGSPHLSHPLLSPRVQVCRKLKSGVEPLLEPSVSFSMVGRWQEGKDD